MTIYHFEFGKLGQGLSGGENCLIQLIKEFRGRGIRNVLLSTDNARAEYEDHGLCEDELFEYRTINSAWTEKWFGALGSYVVRTFMAMRLVRTVMPEPGDILLCNSDFFPNSVPFRSVSGRYPETRLIYWLRMLAPDWLKGFEGHYTGHLKIPSPRFIHYKLAQELFLKLIRRRGVVFVQNTDFLRRLKKRKERFSVFALKGYPGSPQLDFDPVSVDKKYDLAWMGRFHAQKGLFELVDILKRLKQVKPDVSLLLMGGGSRSITKRFWKQCRAAGIAENIHYAGYGGGDRLQLLAQARIYLLTSYYEGSPNVAVEAMSCGLPVVCYDFPIYSMFKQVVTSVDPLDNQAVAEASALILRDEGRLSRNAQDVLAFAKRNTWRGVMDQIFIAVGADDQGGPAGEYANE